jgi:response regulator RpfG family c-di-GMP phosphodiesterase
MPDITITMTEWEMQELEAITPVSSTPEEKAGELLRWSTQGGLDRLIDSLLESWVSLLSIRDLETMEHTRRVTEYTVRLSARMGFPEHELVHIRRGALLHDIGKLGIPDEVLWKNGVLDEGEQVLIRRHPDLAVQVLQPLAFLYPSLDIPRYHHERYDGSGYPAGLRGESIPLAARVFAVVDVWDALSTGRPYSSRTWSPEEICAHFRKEAGRSYDPQVVEQFLSLLEETRPSFKEDVHERH